MHGCLHVAPRVTGLVPKARGHYFRPDGTPVVAYQSMADLSARLIEAPSSGSLGFETDDRPHIV
ncbi:hypothetical protein GCM10027590_34940 [Nocardiopsis nanhaiensis]